MDRGIGSLCRIIVALALATSARAGAADEPRCDNGVHDGSESDVDCGGACQPCGFLKKCGFADDCRSHVCTAGVCRKASAPPAVQPAAAAKVTGQSAPAPSVIAPVAGCNDGAQGDAESDVDCGGACQPCGIGKRCARADDCISHACIGGACREASTPPPVAAEAATAQPAPPSAAAKPKATKPWLPLRYPFMFNSPTGHVLPGASFYTAGGVDTSGGLAWLLEVGLGDVAQFGVAMTDLVRGRNVDDKTAVRLSPYGTASFKMGIGEDRLFKYQPAIALGFRKSFEHDEDSHKTRFAELYLVLSKELGSRVAIHIGGSLFDGEIRSTYGASGEIPAITPEAFQLNQGGFTNQLRPYGGIEISPLPKAHILLELLWTPEFVYGHRPVAPMDPKMPIASTDSIHLTMTLAWGVRYELTSWMNLQAGVRLPNVDEANVLNAQIFLRVELMTRALRRWTGLD